MPPTPAWTFGPLTAADLPRLSEWLSRPHIARWWPSEGTLEGTTREFAAILKAGSATRGFLALWDAEPAAFVQCYPVMGAGEGWWESETDPGARGIDLFIAAEGLLGQGHGTHLIASFVAELFRDVSVTRIQADPAPDNLRAIRACRRAGFSDRGTVITPDAPRFSSCVSAPESPPDLSAPAGPSNLLTVRQAAPRETGRA